jgi:hypothetical protein
VTSFLESHIEDRRLLGAKIRFLLMAQNKDGANLRAIFEERNNSELNQVAESSWKRAWDIYNCINSKGDSWHMSIRSFKFLPSFYIIRMNDRMIVGFYLADKGYFCPYFVLFRRHTTLFDSFMRYFDKVYLSDSLSTKELLPKKTP